MANPVALSLNALPAVDRHAIAADPHGVAFWPMNAALYYHGIGFSKDTITDTRPIAIARRWVTLDWVRVAGATAAFVAPLRALTLPWPERLAPKDPPVVCFLLATALVSVVIFVVWFVNDL